MLYEEGSLTEDQAEQIIGDKMNFRINILNAWLQQNGYYLMLHSTFKDNVKGILSEEGLHYSKHMSIDSKDEILDDCAISETDLNELEKWVKRNKRTGKLNRQYETYPPVEKATVVSKSLITAKQLLEYNHKGGNVTVVFCVPRKQGKKIGRENNSMIGIAHHFDPYLRRSITGKYQKDGSVEFVSEYFYPREGILFVYDRENNKILFNKNYDEEYFLDETSPQRWYIRKGEILGQLRNNDNLKAHSNGRAK